MDHNHSSWLATLECGCPSPAGGLLEERQRVVGLLRALEGLGLGPRDRPRLALALVKLLEFDLLIVGLLTRMQRGEDPGPYVVFVGSLLAIGADKRGKVLAALDDDERLRVAAAFARTRIAVREVLRNIEAMPRDLAPPMLGGIPLPLRDADVEFLATTAWGTVLPWPCGA